MVKLVGMFGRVKQPVQLKPAVRVVNRSHPAPAPPQRIVVVQAGPSPRARSERDLNTLAWLAVGMLVVGGLLPRWQPLLLGGLALLAPLHVGMCVLAMMRGSVFRGMLFLVGTPLVAIVGVFLAWQMVHVR